MARYVFLVGSARSGTTWLQLLLSRHPDVSTCQETHLFSSFLCPMVEGWRRYARDQRGIGLQAVMTESEFNAFLRDIAISVLERIGDTPVILEKTPDHIRVADQILRIIPEAWFIHLVRDPRAVTSSRIDAARSWGAHWAPAGAADNAERWVTDVSSGRELRNRTANYLEIRYEDLCSDPASNLGRVFAWLGLDADARFSQRAVDDCHIDRLRAGAVSAPWALKAEPDGFYRKGTVDSWRRDLTPGEIASVERLAGDLMREFGYHPIMPDEGGRVAGVSGARSAILSVLPMVGKRLRRWLVDRRRPQERS